MAEDPDLDDEGSESFLVVAGRLLALAPFALLFGGAVVAATVFRELNDLRAAWIVLLTLALPAGGVLLFLIKFLFEPGRRPSG